jgi:hypothetical protein
MMKMMTLKMVKSALVVVTLNNLHLMLDSLKDRMIILISMTLKTKMK